MVSHEITYFNTNFIGIIVFIEIDNTIIFTSESELNTLPPYYFVDEEVARDFNVSPFYIYLRPFAH
jgi:hypothetical protein